jgi:Family of unknown function (DUF6090)
VERSSLRVLRELRWEHVVVELALLVVGILVALAVDGWIDGRREARVERQYLELLARDLERDLEMLTEVIAFENAQIDASVTAYRAVRMGVEEADREAVAEALGQLTSRRTLRLSRATYTDLLSTGNLRLIRNTALRDRIVTLYEQNERAQLIRDRNNQEFVDRMYMTYFVDRGLVAPRPTRDLPGIAASDQRFADRAAVPISPRDDRLWSLPPDDPEWDVLAGRVWYRGQVSQAALEQSQRTVAEIDAVRRAVVDELEVRGWP